MIRNTFGAVLVAVLLLLAGCAGSVTSGPSTADDANDGSGAATGTVAFYVSDEPNAIGDFEHLNVTVTKVGLHRTSDATNGTTERRASTEPNGSATASPTATAPSSGDSDGDGAGADGEWIEYEVDRRTVDLTELAGANATKLDVFDAPAGTYDKAFVYVDGIDATLTTGEQATVKLPSERLHVNREFAVGDGESVEFVFDIAPHKAGRSGKYVLKPVVSGSGTGDEVDIRDVDERGDDGLDARFVGPVERGADATVEVTGPDGPVANASVAVGDDVVGETDADGTLSFRVPEGVEELEVTVTADDAETELTVEFDERMETDEAEDDGDEARDGEGGR